MLLKGSDSSDLIPRKADGDRSWSHQPYVVSNARPMNAFRLCGLKLTFKGLTVWFCRLSNREPLSVFWYGLSLGRYRSGWFCSLVHHFPEF